MIKKIVLITVFVIFSGVLIVGAINRTTAKSGYDARIAEDGSHELSQNSQQGERQGQGLGNGGSGQGRNQEAESSSGEGFGKGSEGQGQQGQGGQGQGNGRNAVEGEQGNGQAGGGRNQESTSSEEAAEMVSIEGLVAQAPSSGVDMLLETSDGEVLVGTGPGYLQAQGFELADGDSVTVSGYWEDDEFKAMTIKRLADGEEIMLRDEFGRPMWSGAGRNAQNQGGGGGRQLRDGSGSDNSA